METNGISLLLKPLLPETERYELSGWLMQLGGTSSWFSEKRATDPNEQLGRKGKGGIVENVSTLPSLY